MYVYPINKSSYLLGCGEILIFSGIHFCVIFSSAQDTRYVSGVLIGVICVAVPQSFAAQLFFCTY